MSLSRDLRRCWFAPTSAAPLGLYRIAFGLLAFAYGVLLFPTRFTFFSERGVLTTTAADAYNAVNPPGPRLNLLHGPAADHWLTPFFLLFLLAALCLAVGYRTRLAAVLVFLGLNALHNRNPLIHNGSDLVLVVMAGYLALAPAGAACSLDRLGRVLRGREGPVPPPIVPWALRLMQVQVSLIYLSTGLSKVSGPLWRDGTAVYYALRLPEFGRFPVFFLDPGHLWLVNLLTYGAMAVELAMGTLVWVPRLRLYVLGAAVLLHLGIDYGLNIPLFTPVMIASFLLFLSQADLARFAARLRKSLPKAQLRLLSGDLPTPALSAIRFFDALGLVTVEPTPGTGLAVQDARGRTLTGSVAVRALASRLPALWPIAPLLFLPGLSRPLAAWFKRGDFTVPVSGVQTGSRVVRRVVRRKVCDRPSHDSTNAKKEEAGCPYHH